MSSIWGLRGRTAADNLGISSEAGILGDRLLPLVPYRVNPGLDLLKRISQWLTPETDSFHVEVPG